VIISGGENISSIEVEQAIRAHPAVADCAVVAIPHEVWGERPKAFVALTEGATASADEIVGFCRGRLAHANAPQTLRSGRCP
jgi:fatty-acyl-CoA synthase